MRVINWLPYLRVKGDGEPLNVYKYGLGLEVRLISLFSGIV